MQTVKLWYHADEFDYAHIYAAGFTHFPKEICQPQAGRNNKLVRRTKDTPLWFRPIPEASFAKRVCKQYSDTKRHYLLFFKINKSYVKTLHEGFIDGAGNDASTYFVGLEEMDEFNSNLFGTIQYFKTYG